MGKKGEGEKMSSQNNKLGEVFRITTLILGVVIYFYIVINWLGAII